MKESAYTWIAERFMEPLPHENDVQYWMRPDGHAGLRPAHALAKVLSAHRTCTCQQECNGYKGCEEATVPQVDDTSTAAVC